MVATVANAAGPLSAQLQATPIRKADPTFAPCALAGDRSERYTVETSWADGKGPAAAPVLCSRRRKCVKPTRLKKGRAEQNSLRTPNKNREVRDCEIKAYLRL